MKPKWMNIIRVKLKCQRGAAIIYVSLITMPILMGIGAFSVDIGNLITVNNELKNAADAGALAGGRFLYDPGPGINEDANQEAYNAATENYSQGQPVDVDINVDVQRGHWSFSSRTFTPNSSTDETELWGVDEDTLDADTSWVNAVAVRTWRRGTAPVASWLGRIFERYPNADRTSVAYVGFGEGQADTPWAPCSRYITDDQGNFSCSVGRMGSSGSSAIYETGAWTNLKKCGNNPSADELKGMVCNSGSGNLLPVASNIDVNNGVIPSVLADWLECWDQQTPIHATMPVIECPSGIRPCHKVVGTVKIWIVWITDSGSKFGQDTPSSMGGVDSLGISDWSCNGDAVACWDDFTDHFRLQTPDGRPIKEERNHGLAKKTLYFIPSCEPHKSAGGVGEKNFGIMSKFPVLVDVEREDSVVFQ